MISIPSFDDRSEPIEFEVEEWEPSWAAAQREVLKFKRLMQPIPTTQGGRHEELTTRQLTTEISK
jgi:hypothetical protein